MQIVTHMTVGVTLVIYHQGRILEIKLEISPFVTFNFVLFCKKKIENEKKKKDISRQILIFQPLCQNLLHHPTNHSLTDVLSKRLRFMPGQNPKSYFLLRAAILKSVCRSNDRLKKPLPVKLQKSLKTDIIYNWLLKDLQTSWW